jgi:hypothetical protein
MNVKTHSGAVTGDTGAQCMAGLHLDDRYWVALMDGGHLLALMGCLDAPEDIPTGRTVAAFDTQFQMNRPREML